MSPQAQARLQAAVFARLGEAATWTGVAGNVRVLRREADEELHLDRGTIIEDGGRIRVRQSEVAAPAVGNEVQILDVDGNPVAGALYTVSGEPQLDRKGVWTCTVGPIA